MACLRRVSGVTLAATLLGALVAGNHDVRAQTPCRDFDVAFNPVPNLQIAVWVETAAGDFVDTVYVTRLTGTLGLANRPGDGKFKSDFRFPYGRREMVLPVWANKRGKQYGRVTMGGQDGNSKSTCAASGISPGECDDATIGYHFEVSSPEPFYCSPRGGTHTVVNGIDTMSCASTFYGSKGAYGNSPLFSRYPPRADLTSFVDGHDGPDARGYSTVNELGPVSGATPSGNKVVDPIKWTAPAAGDYVMRVEVSLERDFNAFHNYPSDDDGSPELNSYGTDFMGQPSVVYAVPFTVGDMPATFTTADYQGYGDWDGATGTLHAPDMTISTSEGTGAGRLLDAGGWRVRVRSSASCGDMPTDAGTTTPDDMPSPLDGGTLQPPPDMTCVAPGVPTNLKLVPAPTSLGVNFTAASAGSEADHFDVRFLNGAINDGNFLSGIPSDSPSGAVDGVPVTTTITGLRSETKYYVGVRAVSACGAASPVVSAAATTDQAKFVTLHGCFIATAAYGTPMATQIEALRHVRDRYLLPSSAGQLFVATYYTFAPSFAHAIASDEWLRSATRSALAPLVRVANWVH